jgi:AcrR family transcriptional regulator
MVNSAIPVRRRLSVEDRQNEVVEVCVRLIGTHDWDTVTMADIAAEAQISKGLLYHYFSAKPDLYVAAVRRAAAQLSEATAPNPSLPPQERVRYALAAHVNWVDEHALAYRTVLHGGLSGAAEVQAIVEVSRAQVLERIARDSGFTSVTPSLQIALRGWVGFLEAACLAWLDTRATTKDELVRLIASLLPAAIKVAR